MLYNEGWKLLANITQRTEANCSSVDVFYNYFADFNQRSTSDQKKIDLDLGPRDDEELLNSLVFWLNFGDDYEILSGTQKGFRKEYSILDKKKEYTICFDGITSVPGKKKKCFIVV